ncbi:peptide deformylase [Oligoflexia bacterium]|nr:peptide deformylase [Oligoflexia bacterium]
MALLEIRTYPDPILREVSVEVMQFDQALAALLDNMLETMYHEDGIGLAAPQVAVLQRVIVMDVSHDRSKPMALINPVIVEQEGEVVSEEGCLSVPEYRDKVTRSDFIQVQACDRTGKKFEFEADDLLAICIQHEMDHLDGTLFIDRISRLKRDMFKRRHKKRSRVGKDV